VTGAGPPFHHPTRFNLECNDVSENSKANAPKITLAGRDWPVPLLAIKQNRIVIPALMKIMPAVARIASVSDGQDMSAEDMAAALASLTVTTEEFDLVSDAVYAALTRGTPGLARNEFDNLPIATADLFAALPVIMAQTGIMKKQAPDGDGVPAGEATAQ
jgi:hypothetical protein